jgi:hypothetical protein
MRQIPLSSLDHYDREGIMTERKLKLMDIRELLLHLRAQSSDRQIRKDTGLNRRTIKRYREWAHSQGLLEGP